MKKFEKIFDRFTDSKQIHEAVLLIENLRGNLSFSKGYGGKDINSPLLMASITKLFTTTCILILLEQGKLSLKNKITGYFDNLELDGIHVYKGNEYTSDLTIGDLLFQTSGLPDVYEEGKNSIKNLAINEDFYMTFDEFLIKVKKLKPHFAPNNGSRAYYADINFDILGEIIKKISKLSLEDAYKYYIFNPLGLNNTYIPTDENDYVPGIYYKSEVIHRPKIIISSSASGGGISTAFELMTFIKAFFGGKLFNKEIFKELSTYRKLQITMSPIKYGGGYMQVSLNGLNTLFMGQGELIGHSGSTGSFAFYYPEKELFIVGDVNQMANASLPVRLSMQLAIGARN